jgi:hypothetical protein
MKNNKQTYTIILCAVLLTCFSSCRKEKIKPDQAETFIKYYGKGGTQTAGNVVVTSDGGYILVGTSDSYSNSKDILVVKTDKYGNEVWSKVLGGAGDDAGNFVQLTSDGGYILTGAKAEAASLTNTDEYIVKLSADGTIVWDKTYGVAGKNESGNKIINTLDGGYISVGTTTAFTGAVSGVYLIKTNTSGDTLWTAKYGNNNVTNIGTGIQQISDVSYLTSASTIDATGTASDMLVTTGRLQNGTAYNANSNIRKQTVDADIIDAKDIILNSTGDKYILGNTVQGDMYIADVSATEQTIFYKAFGTTAQDQVSGFSRTFDGGFIIAGSTMINGNWDVLVMRTDANATVLWTKTFGDTGNDYGTSVVQTSDGTYVVSASIQFGGNGTGSNEVMSLIHINANGELK